MADDRPMAGVMRTKPTTKTPRVQKKATANGVKTPARGAKGSARKAAAPGPKPGPKTPIKRGSTEKGPGKKAPTKKGKLPPALEVDPDVMEFIAAIDRFKNRHNRPFPSWSEVLHVLRGLGYRKA